MRFVLIPLLALVLGTGVVSSLSCSSSETKAGPLGGDVVPLEDGGVRAEVLANSETGEVVVRTWEPDADEPRPIAAEPMVVGQGDQSVALEPVPLETDPRGLCSRFYGQADWMRAGQFHTGWLTHGDAEASMRHAFTCRHCWKAGREHAGGWRSMADHRERMMGHGGAARRPR